MKKLDVILDRIEKDTKKECSGIIRDAEEKTQIGGDRGRKEDSGRDQDHAL